MATVPEFATSVPSLITVVAIRAMWPFSSVFISPELIIALPFSPKNRN